MRNPRTRNSGRKRRTGGVIVSVLIVLIYLLLFPAELAPELLLRRAWTLVLSPETDPDGSTTTLEDTPADRDAASRTAEERPSSPDAARTSTDDGGAAGSDGGMGSTNETGTDAEEGTPTPFTLGEFFGFIDPRGTLRYQGRSLFGVSMDSDRFANYARVSESLVIQDRSGRLIQTIPEPGYPLLSAGRTLVFAPDGRSLSEWNDDGVEVWSRRFSSVITDIDIVANAIGIGFLDGSVGLLIEEGGRVLRFEPRGSRVEVTYGVAVNEDGSDMAAVSGLDPQRLTVLETSSDGLTPVRQRELRDAYRRPVFLRFLTRDLLVLEQTEGMLLVDLSADREVVVPLIGRVVAAVYMAEHDVVGIVSRSGANVGGDAHLYLLRPSGDVVVHRPIGREAIGLTAADRTLVLGVAQRLLGISPYEG